MLSVFHERERQTREDFIIMTPCFIGSKKYGFEIPDPEIKKAPDPGSATPSLINRCVSMFT
jgi:hypothetical protein